MGHGEIEDIFRSHHKTELFLGVILFILVLFLNAQTKYTVSGLIAYKVKVQNWNKHLGCQISNIFWGMLDNPNIFLRGKQYMLGPSLRIKRN